VDYPFVHGGHTRLTYQIKYTIEERKGYKVYKGDVGEPIFLSQLYSGDESAGSDETFTVRDLCVPCVPK